MSTGQSDPDTLLSSLIIAHDQHQQVVEVDLKEEVRERKRERGRGEGKEMEEGKDQIGINILPLIGVRGCLLHVHVLYMCYTCALHVL